MDIHTDISLRHGLAGYVVAVAAEVGVPVEGTGFEVSDTATAYLGLAGRQAGRDLMLVWGERVGWSVAVETTPSEPPSVIARLGGVDPVPDPRDVGRFAVDVQAGRGPGAGRPDFRFPGDRDDLAGRLSRYAVDLV
jgi:hypothetical protein